MKGQYDMERRKITWKDVALILLGIVLSASGWGLKTLYAEVQDVKKDKIGRTEFYQVIQTSNKDINEKIDVVIQLIKQHREDTEQ